MNAPTETMEAANRIEDYVRRVVAEAPPLSDEQRERIVAMLRSAGGDPRANV